FLLGLVHEEASVRATCASALDHLADEATFPALIESLDDPSADVRSRALHALACDRCKQEGVCPPSAGQVLAVAIRMLATDPDRSVRTAAAGVVGNYVHDDERAVAAL